MSRYKLSEFLNLNGNNQLDTNSLVKGLMEETLIGSLDLYLGNVQPSDIEIQDITTILGLEDIPQILDILQKKYPIISNIYDNLELRIVANLLRENIKGKIESGNFFNKRDLLLELSKKLEQFVIKEVLNGRNEDEFNKLYEEYKLITNQAV